MRRSSFCFFISSSCILSLSLTHTHTHTHARRAYLLHKLCSAAYSHSSNEEVCASGPCAFIQGEGSEAAEEGEGRLEGGKSGLLSPPFVSLLSLSLPTFIAEGTGESAHMLARSASALPLPAASVVGTPVERCAAHCCSASEPNELPEERRRGEPERDHFVQKVPRVLKYVLVLFHGGLPNAQL